MKIPEQVKVGPYVYKVVHKDDLRSDDDRKMFGQINYINHEVSLWSGLTSDRAPVTFWHEVLHGLSDLTESGLKEKQISRMAPALAAFLADNDLLKDGE